jgi:hypothetical protein
MRGMKMALAAVALAAAPAQAAVVFSDNFDGENGGASGLSYSDFANFTVLGDVDLVRSGDYEITCSGSCVDLDGSPGSGALRSGVFNYSAGDTIELFLTVSGNQRRPGSDNLLYEFFSTSDGIFNGTTALASNSGFLTGSVGSFTATADGSVYFTVGTDSNDSAGPILDSLWLEIRSAVGAVPEPSTWAMMIAGFAFVGSTMRRRKVSVSFA